jgi:hypothetical protein
MRTWVARRKTLIVFPFQSERHGMAILLREALPPNPDPESLDSRNPEPPSIEVTFGYPSEGANNQEGNQNRNEGDCFWV